MFPKLDNPLKQLAALSAIGFQMGAIIAVGAFIGVALDEKYPNENNLFTLILTLFSVILSVFYVIKRINSSLKDKNK